MELEFWHPTKNEAGPVVGHDLDTLYWFFCKTCRHEWQTTIRALHQAKRKPCAICRWPINRKRVKQSLEKLRDAGQIAGFQCWWPIPNSPRRKMDFRVETKTGEFFYCWVQLPVHLAHYRVAKSEYIKTWEYKKDWCLNEGVSFLELPYKGNYQDILLEFLSDYHGHATTTAIPDLLRPGQVGSHL